MAEVNKQVSKDEIQRGAGLSPVETSRGPKPALQALQSDVLHMTKANQWALFAPSLLYSCISKHHHFPIFPRHSPTIVGRSGFLPNSFNNIVVPMLCVHVCKSACVRVCVYRSDPKGWCAFCFVPIEMHALLLCSTALGALSANQLIHTSDPNPAILLSGWLRHG